MLFSILIPAYKASFLKEALESVLSQTFDDYEVIIVNDNSPENIDDIVHMFNDKHIRYYKNKKNCGAENVVDNWNICLSYAHGDYVVCMGDDDKVKPNFLEEYYKLIIKYPNVNVFHSRIEIIDEKSNVIRLCSKKTEFESIYLMLLHRWEGYLQYIGDFLFKKEALLKEGGFYKIPYGLGSDDITVTLVGKEDGIVNVEIPTFQYRSSRKTISSSGNERKTIHSIILNEKWYYNFLTNFIPIDKNDQLTRNKLLNKIERRFNKLKYIIMVSSFQKGIFSNLKYWIQNRNEMHIPIITIAKAFASGLYHKMIRSIYFLI